jgi:hypothetical protein
VRGVHRRVHPDLLGDVSQLSCVVKGLSRVVDSTRQTVVPVRAAQLCASRTDATDFSMCLIRRLDRASVGVAIDR